MLLTGWLKSWKSFGTLSRRVSGGQRHRRNGLETMRLVPAQSSERLEDRLLLTTAAQGDQFVVAETFGIEASPPVVAVQGSGAFTAAWQSFEEDGSGLGIFAQRFAADGSPSGMDAFQVNTHVTGDQSAPAIATDSAGNVLVVWQSKGQDGDGWGIYGQWYDSMGAIIGGEFLVNSETDGDQRAPSVAMDAAGNAIVAWQSSGQDGDGEGVFYKRFDSPGDTTGTELQANDAFVGEQQAPTVAAAANGNFVIAWEASDPAGGAEASLDVYAKVFDSDGDTIAGELKVNTESLRDQVTPHAAMDANGDFVVVWVSEGIPGSGSDIFGQRFDQHGDRLGLEFDVNDTTRASQVGATVAMDGAGNFLVTWQSVVQDGSSEGVIGREYDFDGDTLKGEFIVNSTVEGPQSSPFVAMNTAGQAVAAWIGKNETHQSTVYAQRFQVPETDPDFFVGDELQLGTFVEVEGSAPAAAMDVLGNTVVVWESYDEDGSSLGVFAQQHDNFGDPIGEKFLVNDEFTEGNQNAPAVARSADGQFVVAWQSNNQDGDGYGIYARRYGADGSPLSDAFQVNTTIDGDQKAPAVAIGDDGRFIVVFQGGAEDGTTNIYARRYDAMGVALGDEFQVNHLDALDQFDPAVTMNAAGQFAIAWVSNHPAAGVVEEGEGEDSEKSIFVQWYDANGVSTGDEVIAHNFVEEAQEAPVIGMDATGNFVVAWQSINQDGSTFGVYARQFRADKTPVQAGEFQVNETTDGIQRLAGIGVQADGHFVIAWESTSPSQEDDSSTDIYRREYLPDGTPDGSENLVNNWTGGPQTLPVVARAATGNYGIFWTGQGFSHIDGVHGRLYDINLSDDPGEPSRIPVGDQFLVHETLGFENGVPAVAMNSDGTFTVAFETFEEDGSGFGVFMERFHADGTPMEGSRVQVNTTTLDDQSAPAIASDGDGNLLIVWQSKDTGGYGIFGQWFDEFGEQIGGEFRVNATVAGDQTAPDVALDQSGRAVVAWQGQDVDGTGIYYVRLDSIGDTSGTELPANTLVDGDQQAPSVAAAAVDGQFVITWQGPGPVEESEEGGEVEASVEVFARRFNAAGVAQGSEFQVNDELQKDQILPDVAMDADGDAVIVWQAEGQQSSGSDVFGRRMDSNGNLLDDLDEEFGGDFQVNVTTTRPQRLPSVAMDADGNFLVGWQSQHQDGFSWGIYGREYAANGDTLQTEFAINERVEGPQTKPGIAMNASGQALVAWLGNDSTHHPAVLGHRYLVPNTEPDLSVGGELTLLNYAGIEETPPAAAMNAHRESVVAWTSYAEDGSGLGVFAQMFDDHGVPLGDRFAVNDVTLGNQLAPTVARAPSGEFVIAWESEGQDGDGYGIFAQRYAADGAPVGSVFQVNSITEGDQTRAAAAMAPDGSFVITWQSVSEDGSLDVMARRYTADGDAEDVEFRVNHFTGLDQKDPAIAMNASGQYVIAWVSDHPALTDPNDGEKSVFVQWFDADGQSVGDEVLVHRYVKDAQEAPAVGIDASGQFVVAWQSINQDGNSWGVFARRFEADKTPIDRSEFTVNETRLGPQRYVGIGTDEFGRFVIVWQSNSRAELAGGEALPNADEGGGDSGGSGGSEEGSSWDVFSRQYAFDGRHEGAEQPVNQWTMGPQTLPVIAQTTGGDFGVFWLGQGPDHIEGVHGRLYESLFDFGDAPESVGGNPHDYPTLLASDGARHLPGSTLFLGEGVDVELDGQPTGAANGDDLSGETDDEDGVEFAEFLRVSPFSDRLGTVSIFVGSTVEIMDAKLDAWIDFNHDGDWNDAGEQIFDDLVVTPGENILQFTIPIGARIGTTVSRFRLSSNGVEGPTGAAQDGEVEDHTVTFHPGWVHVRAEHGRLLIDDLGSLDNDITVKLDTAANPDVYVISSPRADLSADGITATNIVRVLRSDVTAGMVANLDDGNDRLTFNTLSLSATVHGGDGNDTILAGSGHDQLFGEEGNDSVRGGSGNDTVSGGTGTDTVTGDSGTDTRREETDSAVVVVKSTTIVGVGSAPGEAEAIGSGINRIQLVGGESDNLFDASLANLPVILEGNGGDDILLGGSGADQLLGGEGEDSLNGNAGNDTVEGGEDDDTLTGGTGNDSLDGGSGTNTLLETRNASFTLTDTSLSGNGTDKLIDLQIAHLTGGTSSNTFTVSGWSGTGTLTGGGGTDTIVVSKNADFTLTNSGLQINANMAQLNQEDEFTWGLSGFSKAKLTGGAGNNTFVVSEWTGGGTVTGGAGDDTLIAERNANHTLTNTSLATIGFGTLSLSGLENAELTGGAGNNTFTVSGWTGDGRLTGGGGIDTLVKSKNANFELSDEQLSTSDGMDLVLDGFSVANLTGGGSANVFLVSAWHGTGTINGSSGTDRIEATRDADTTLTNALLTSIVEVDGFNANGGFGSLNLSSIETANLSGGEAGNTLNASQFTLGSVTLQGGAGNDVLIGGSKNDVLIGGDGDDSLSGGAGRDLLIGGAGEDTLNGDAGEDILIGGTTDYSDDGADITALNAIMSEWGSGGSYAHRIGHLRDTGVGAGHTIKLNADTVQDDEDDDTLNGGADKDWFFESPADVLDAITGETVTTLEA